MGERAGRAGRIGRRLLGLGCVMFRWRDRGRRSEAEFAPLQRRVRQAIEAGVAQTLCKRSAATCANLLDLWPALWGFLRQSGVEPTNNAAEQALRTLVLKRKISGLTRSRRGEEFLARGYTVLESCRRQGRDALDFLRQALQAHFGGIAVPSLVPSG
ncbi:IS66 family transposase [Leptothrix cholodnii]|uniref:IS66 family transposase n=1 Tax=Leptothrix cholodnii TaxID=34029 RepID=UPI000A0121AC|nr:transposase [Leptothrix cholodnii]